MVFLRLKQPGDGVSILIVRLSIRALLEFRYSTKDPEVPIGALTTIGIGFLLHIRQTFTKASGNAWQVFSYFDPIGNTLFISAIICLLLALHWGGDTYQYSNGRIIALFVLFGLLLIGFVIVQLHRSEDATGKVSQHVTIMSYSRTWVY